MALIIDFIQNFAREFIYLTLEMGIYLLIGFLVAGIIHAFLPDGFVSKHVGKKGFWSSFKSAMFGVPLPLCSCGVVPTALSLKKSKASNGAVVSFLISTPQTGIDSIAATYSLLGSAFAFFRVIVAFITGVIGGFITDLFVRGEEYNPEIVEENPCGCGSEETSCCSTENHIADDACGCEEDNCECEEDSCGCNSENDKSHYTFLEKVKEVFRYGFGELLESIAKWLVLGLVIGALISVIVPDNFFSLYLSNRFLTYLLILAVSVPVYICATGSIPIASSLILKGVSPGAAFVFLMAGPATNSVTFTVLLKTIGKKSTLIYIFTIIMGAVVGGLIIDFYFIDLMLRQIAANHSAQTMSIVKIVGGIIFAILLIFALIPKKKDSCGCEVDLEEERLEQKFEPKVFKVKGMTCNHCKINVSRIVESIKGIKNYSINLEAGELVVEGEFDLTVLKESLEEYGYSIK
ncbi:SO_0444 family Cu/Zn efflux transporter [Thermotomaculum hydrothermale]|nr:SO_0444 family Cu/Zn efflux transporter [Thermotomaculum hydrothermale]